MSGGINRVYRKIQKKKPRYIKIKIDPAVRYWANIHKSITRFNRFKRRDYVYKLWGREKFKKIRRLKENYVQPRLIRSYFLILTRKMINHKVQVALKRGSGVFMTRLVEQFEGRLFSIVYRVN